MKIKFGDRVEVVSGEFFKGVKGTAVHHSKSDNMYTIQLEHGCTREFYGEALRKVAKGRSKK